MEGEAQFDVEVTVGTIVGTGMVIQGNMEQNDNPPPRNRIEAHFGINSGSSEEEVQVFMTALKELFDKENTNSEMATNVALSSQDVVVTLSWPTMKPEIESSLQKVMPTSLSLRLETSKCFSALNLTQNLYTYLRLSGTAYPGVLEELQVFTGPIGAFFRKLLSSIIGLTLKLKFKDLAQAMAVVAEATPQLSKLFNWELVKQKLHAKAYVSDGSVLNQNVATTFQSVKCLTNVNKVVICFGDRKFTLNIEGGDIWKVFQIVPPVPPPDQPLPQ